MKKVLINLTPEQKAWAKSQPKGMAAYIRQLIDNDMACNNKWYVRAILAKGEEDETRIHNS